MEKENILNTVRGFCLKFHKHKTHRHQQQCIAAAIWISFHNEKKKYKQEKMWNESFFVIIFIDLLFNDDRWGQMHAFGIL